MGNAFVHEGDEGMMLLNVVIYSCNFGSLFFRHSLTTKNYKENSSVAAPAAEEKKIVRIKTQT